MTITYWRPFRLGLPSYPAFNKGSQELINDAHAAGAGTEAEINQYVAQALKNKELQFCVEDPAAKTTTQLVCMACRTLSVPLQRSRILLEAFIRH